MMLNGALTNLGAAGAGALGAILLATGGYSTLGVGLGATSMLTVVLPVRSPAPNQTPELLRSA